MVMSLAQFQSYIDESLPATLEQVTLYKNGTPPLIMQAENHDDFISAVFAHLPNYTRVKMYFNDLTWKVVFTRRQGAPDSDSESSDDESEASMGDGALVPVGQTSLSSAALTPHNEPLDDDDSEDVPALDDNQVALIKRALNLLDKAGIVPGLENVTLQLEAMVGTCHICQSALFPMHELPCKHILCVSCIVNILQSPVKDCPYCRHNLRNLISSIPLLKRIMRNVSGVPQSVPSNSTSSDMVQIFPPPSNPFSEAMVHVVLENKPTIDITLSLQSTVAQLRNLACAQWGFPQSYRTKCSLTFNGTIITASPLRHLATVGITHLSTVHAKLNLGSGGAPKVIKTITKDTRVAQLKASLRMNTFKSVME